MIVFVLGVLLILIAIGVVYFALAGSRESRGVDRSLAVLEAMTTAPAAVTSEADRPFAERVVAPLQHRALTLGRRLSGADSNDRIRRKLDLAGNPGDWTADKVISVKVMGTIVVTAVALVFALVAGFGVQGIVLLTVTGLLLGFFLPDLILYQGAYTRAEKIERELPDAIDLLTISVEAGLGFDAALQQVSRNTTGPLSDELSRMLAEMQIGSSRSEALRGLAERTNVDNLKAFVTSMVQADSFGVPIAQVLRVQSAEMRTKRRQRAETKAQQVPVKMTVPLIFFILPCLFIAIMGPAAINIMDNF